MKIRSVRANQQKRAFDLTISSGSFSMPYVRLPRPPVPEDPVVEVFVDPELGNEAFTYRLASGGEDSVHLDAVLDYNRDPDTLRNLLLYRLTAEAQRRVQESDLSKRELTRRLGTSASQFYRLLDQTNYRKSIDQMLALLQILDCDVDLVVRDRPRAGARSPATQ